ncbi:ADYC domain-containing protein [Pyxidicoccus xibeiensis]|uniref:ADYC domain-containing protein n=1 Tax=Pyxidicoccus xibeiensis TaxID=2906759 RepID=UPI0020A7D777|nr:ADYC domain-containing protein [Pyxidicoccus xibeiensis]MCP3141465.1 hypothetical protein [Pyxidicoccus xibeiensis]
MSPGESMQGPWRGWALLVALAACACGGVADEPGALPDETGLEASRDGGTVSAQGYERQGEQRSAFLHASYEQNDAGPTLKGFSLRSLAAGRGSVVDTGAVHQGSLQVRRSVQQGVTASLLTCFGQSYGEARGCGWKSGGVGRCTPGTSVTVSTGPCEQPGAEDTVLRVCSGFAPCEHTSTSKLASNDDSCGTLAAHATFQCPASGTFSVLVGAYSSTSPLTAVPVAEGASEYPHFNAIQQGAELKDARVQALTTDGQVIPMRILQVHDELGPDYVHTGRYGGGVTHRYVVAEERADGQLALLCGPDVDHADTGQGLPTALPVTGWWDTSGARQEDPGFFTFSCGRGVIAKCYRWGYRPWDERSAQGSGMSAAMLHQTCTRMARADYCGDGRSWTVNDTPVNLWDTADIQTRDTPRSGHSFESGWMPWGAICLNHVRWSHAPTDVFYEGCPTLFDNIQQPDGGVQRVPRYCDSMEQALEKEAWTPLFNESALNLFPGTRR